MPQIRKKRDCVGIVDADLLNGGTRHPNLALMKIAGFLHDNKYPFELIVDTNADVSKYKYVFISKVFTFTPNPGFYQKALDQKKDLHRFKVGGTGFYAIENNIKRFTQERVDDMSRLEKDPFLRKLPNKYDLESQPKGINISRQMPFYRLYDSYIENKIAAGRKSSYYNDYKSFSIGFLTRGCFRHCPFCVNKLENNICEHSKLEWFLDNERNDKGQLIRPYIYLWDDNFLAAKPEVWRSLLKQLIDTGRKFQFRQGLDERILATEHGEEIAELLSKCNYYGDYIFAFDNWREREIIEKALKIWKFYNPKKETKFYLFTGYMMKPGDNKKLYKDIWELFQRIKIIMQYGCFGYVMRHEDYRNHEMNNIYTQIARWCNQPQFYRYMSFWEYCYRNQSYWEQTTLKRTDIPNLKTYEEFVTDRNNGYYNTIRICKPLQSLLDILEMYPDKRDELLEMFNYKMKSLLNPALWAR